MKLNADVGEGMESDGALMPWIDCANVACGGHAGGPEEMRRTVELALTHAVSIGAHPGYPDPENFGRVSLALPPEEITALVHEQIDRLDAVCRDLGAAITYVKPHGALYHDMMHRPEVLDAILRAVSTRPRPLALVMMARPALRQYDRSADSAVALIHEAFADRAYTETGALLPRTATNAVYTNPDAIVDQAAQLLHGNLLSADGHPLSLRAGTLCLHGDNPASLAAAPRIHHLLRA